MPNLVWSAGRIAAITRITLHLLVICIHLPLFLGKTALAVLHALLRVHDTAPSRKLSTCFEKSASKLFPALRTTIEDYDTSSREISLRYVC